MSLRNPRLPVLLLTLCLLGTAAPDGQTPLYTSESAFLSALTNPTVTNFDALPVGSALHGREFENQGVTIRNVEGHPIYVASWTAGGNLLIPSAPNAISSSYASTPEAGFSAACCGVYFNNAASDHIKFTFTTPASAAGIHVGENDFRGVTLTWYDIDGNIISTHAAGAFNPGNGFLGLVSPNTPIGSLVVYNAAHDGDGMFFDNLIFEPACVTSPPIISNANIQKSLLWPPNHALVPLKVDYSVTGSCGAAAACSLRATSSEPDEGLGDGDLPGDTAVIDANTVALRAERSGTGTGRRYTVEIVCTDDRGETSTQPLTVTVPHGVKRGAQ